MHAQKLWDLLYALDYFYDQPSVPPLKLTLKCSGLTLSLIHIMNYQDALACWESIDPDHQSKGGRGCCQGFKNIITNMS